MREPDGMARVNSQAFRSRDTIERRNSPRCSSPMPWHLPHPPLRGRGLSAQLLGLAAAALAARLVGAVIPTSSGYALKAAMVFAGIALVSLGYLRDNHPFDRFG